MRGALRRNRASRCGAGCEGKFASYGAGLPKRRAGTRIARHHFERVHAGGQRGNTEHDLFGDVFCHFVRKRILYAIGVNKKHA